jgi:hypothetical protein
MNTVFGRFSRVEAEELFDPAAVAENKAPFLIFDVQTHHVAMPDQVLFSLCEFRQNTTSFFLRHDGEPLNVSRAVMPSATGFNVVPLRIGDPVFGHWENHCSGYMLRCVADHIQTCPFSER